LNAGHQLGPYEILEPLGAGGMGEVWLAQDTRLGRQVAIKVLPAEFASDPERLARFEQEARASAALNHPHIAAVFDVGAETVDGTTTHYMVQEYLQGHTLRSVLDPGALKLERALVLGVEIAEALRAAHKAGIVHRDLKPENIFVTEDGHAKVLDFGLAKLTESATPAMGSQSMSPTVLGTQAGAIMGTAGYMAPEQAQGEEVDHRADLFAFGCVLYEMATGRQPFAGKNVYDTIGRIVSDEPSAISEIDPNLPAQLQWIVRKCLAKEPAQRYQGAGDLAVDLATLAGDAKSGLALPAGASAPAATAIAPVSPRPSGLLAAVAAAALLAGALGSWALLRPGPAEPAPVRRFILPVPGSQRLPSNTPPIAISPDGTSLVTLAISGGERWLELRRMDQLEAREIPGTRDVGGSPFFSPDGRWIGFETENRIYRASLAGEPPQTLVQASDFRGATWTDADQIVYSDADRLFVVDAAGGDPQPVPVPDNGGPAALRQPAALPGGRHVLATRADSGTFSTVLVELASGQVRELIAQGSGARYAGGYVIYGRDRFLFAAPFDPEPLELTGEPVPMVEGVQSGGGGQVHFDVSAEGTLVYSPSRDGATGVVTRLALTDFEGGLTVLPLPLESHWGGRLSPDGRRVTVATGDRGSRDIFVYDVRRGAAQRLTAGDGFSAQPLWAPDGSWIYFEADRAGVRGIYRRPADAMADEELILETDRSATPSDISADGSRLVFTGFSEDTRDVGILDLNDGEVEWVANSGFREGDARLSPDGRWLAYMADDTGEPRIYVLDLQSGRRTPISTTVALWPIWSRDGSTLFFYDATEEAVIATALRVVGDALEVGDPTTVFQDSELLALLDAAPDGERLLVLLRGVGAEADGSSGQQLNVTLNWFEEITARRREQ